jgi:hypothetical protein
VHIVLRLIYVTPNAMWLMTSVFLDKFLHHGNKKKVFLEKMFKFCYILEKICLKSPLYLDNEFARKNLHIFDFNLQLIFSRKC